MAEWVARAKAHASSAMSDLKAARAMQIVLDSGMDILDVETLNSKEFMDYVVMKVGLPLETSEQLEMGGVILKKFGIKS